MRMQKSMPLRAGKEEGEGGWAGGREVAHNNNYYHGSRPIALIRRGVRRWPGPVGGGAATSAAPHSPAAIRSIQGSAVVSQLRQLRHHRAQAALKARPILHLGRRPQRLGHGTQPRQQHVLSRGVVRDVPGRGAGKREALAPPGGGEGGAGGRGKGGGGEKNTQGEGERAASDAWQSRRARSVRDPGLAAGLALTPSTSWPGRPGRARRPPEPAGGAAHARATCAAAPARPAR